MAGLGFGRMWQGHPLVGSESANLLRLAIPVFHLVTIANQSDPLDNDVSRSHQRHNLDRQTGSSHSFLDHNLAAAMRPIVFMLTTKTYRWR